MRNMARCENRPRGGLGTRASGAEALSHRVDTHPMFLRARDAGQKWEHAKEC